MPPLILCLIVLAMPFAAVAFLALGALAERRPVSAKGTAGDVSADIDDDSTLFR